MARDAIYCSVKCRAETQKAKPYKLICKQCGVTFFRTLQRQSKQKFCSRKCSQAFGHTEETRAKLSKAHKGRPCSEAAKRASSLHHKGKKYSEEQMGKFRAATKSLWTNPTYAAKVRDANKKPEANAYRTHEWKEKIGATNKARWARLSEEEKARWAKSVEPGRIKAVYAASRTRPTSIERKLYEILNELEIPHEAQYQIGKYVVDALIPNINLIIEADGEYWHSKPEQIEKDKIRDKWLTEKGYQIIRLPGKEIKADTRLALLRRLTTKQKTILNVNE
jgi:very-short-patch-repair endonuclease